jgi:NADP-dependent 3-hydroxy acid dehydrogenase YdfG
MNVKKVVVITGAGSGLGKALAIGLSREDCVVIAGVRRAEEINEIQERLSPESSAKVCDITNPADCEGLIEYAVSRHGKMDVLINNAGMYVMTSYIDTPPEKIHQVLDVAVMGSANISKFALDQMNKQRSGHIISISDATFKTGLPEYNTESPHTVDLAAKFAKVELHNLLRYEASQYGVNVTTFYMHWLASNLDIDDPAEPSKGANHPKEAVEKIAMIIEEPVDEYILKT